MRFLGYIISYQGIQIEKKQIKAIRDWPELQSVRDIQIFLGFANFYQWFIQGFSGLAAPLTSMLKTTSVVGPAENPKQGGKKIQMEDQGEKKPAQKSCKGQKNQKIAKSKKWIRAEKAETSKAKNLGQSGLFLTVDARKPFTKLTQAFVKALILNHFDSERYIRIETDVSGYAIGGILSQLTSNDLGRWHLVAFFSRKIIPAEIWY